MLMTVTVTFLVISTPPVQNTLLELRQEEVTGLADVSKVRCPTSVFPEMFLTGYTYLYYDAGYNVVREMFVTKLYSTRNIHNKRIKFLFFENYKLLERKTNISGWYLI